jgi:hypothetical protein
MTNAGTIRLRGDHACPSSDYVKLAVGFGSTALAQVVRRSFRLRLFTKQSDDLVVQFLDLIVNILFGFDLILEFFAIFRRDGLETSNQSQRLFLLLGCLAEPFRSYC